MIRKAGALLSALGGLALLAQAATADAQEYPRQGVVSIVVPFAAGGTTDRIARLVAEGLGHRTGGTFIVDNRPGFAGNIGAEYVAKARPDGYTLLLGGIVVNALNPALYDNLPFQAATAFTAIAHTGAGPFVLVSNPRLGLNSIQDLIAAAKARSGTFSYGSAGIGTGLHILMELFKSETGIDVEHVPYRGSAPAMTDVIAGHVNVMFNNLDTALPQIQAGSLTALALTSAERSPLLPNVPTVAEAGFPKLTSTAWVGLFAPAGTPAPIIETLNRNVVQIMNAPETVAKLGELGMVPASMSAEQFADFVRTEVERWRPVVKASGAKPTE